MIRMKVFKMKKAQIKSLLWVMHISWIIAMCIVVITGGVQHDYTFYLAQWRLAFSSPAIWVSNAYGPIHVILAYACVFGSLGPKIIMCSTFLIIDNSLKPVILAGGLNPDNVLKAIEFCNPSGVDSHTGLEDENGFKDYQKVKLFYDISMNYMQLR